MDSIRRKKTDQLQKGSELPSDYLKLVTELYTSHFHEGLEALNRQQSSSHFYVGGAVYPDEVVLSASLMQKEAIAATTIHASCDFDPRASAPTLMDLLEACVDAAGSLWTQLLDPQKPEQLENLTATSLSALENIPFDWSPAEANRIQIFLKIDKSNPKLDQMTEEWLAKHDPDSLKKQEEEQQETENLFFTGPKKKGD